MSPYLSRAIGQILGLNPVTPEERDRVIEETPADAKSFDDLPDKVRRLLSEIDSRSWPAPALFRVAQRVIERAPYPGQKFRHGWIPVAGAPVSKPTYSEDDIQRTYGDPYDYYDFAPGMRAQIGTDDDGYLGTIHILVSATEQDRFYVFADMDQDDSNFEFLSNALDWAAWRDLDEYGHRPPDAQNGLVDWHEDDGAVVGFDRDGNVRIGWPAADEPGQVDVIDLTRDEAQDLYRALQNLNAVTGEE